METKIIVGVSGGPDSMYLLNKLNEEGKDVIVAHVNYHLRDESNEEQEMLTNFCSEKNIKLEVLDVQKKDWEEIGQLKNKQSMARELRFNFYLKLAKQYNSNEIYLAHHKDDFIETAIMLKNRSEDYLFYGIQDKNEYLGVNIVRPLLNIYKNDIIKYNDENNIPYRMDKSNEEPIYDRNRIRLELKDKSEEYKESIYQEFISINKDRQELREKSINLYKEWKKNDFSYDFYFGIEEKYKKYVLYQFLILSEVRININKDKIEGIIEFLKNKRGDKDFRLMESIYLGVKSNIIKVYKK